MRDRGSILNQPEIIVLLEDYEATLSDILLRFQHTASEICIRPEDEASYRQITKEIADLLGDELVDGRTERSNFIGRVNESVSNYLGSPSKYGVETVQALIRAILNRIRRNPQAIKSMVPSLQPTALAATVAIVALAQRIHLIARQLRERHDDRPTLDLTDEYDLQDLFHALLKVHFDDVRPEEYTPSYAGKSARMDFLLPESRIVVELKMTRSTLSAKQVGEQLIIDINRYRAHQGCQTLFCIVYDPTARITNPRGLENDLNRDDDRLAVRVMVVPN